MTRTPDNHSSRQPALLSMIYDEIMEQNWAQPAQVLVEELGLSMGTHPGLKRSRNEDRVAAARILAPNGELYSVAILCDGVGGSESGDRAAALAVAYVVAQLAEQRERPGLKDLVAILVTGADAHVRTVLAGRGATTLVLLLATAAGLLVCASVGDSRGYRWDPKAGAALAQVTTDDTIENELRNLPGDHAALLQERGLRGRLSQAIGEDGRTVDELRVQVYTREKFVNGALLGSDGLWRAAQDFESVAVKATSPGDLVRRVLTLANWVGGVDNATVLAIDDLELFCRPRGQQPMLASSGNLMVSLWMPQGKIKIPIAAAIGEAVSVGKASPRTKRRTSKSKTVEGGAPLKQLSLESSPAESAKPKLEVTFGDDSKQ